jgi:hypothetical protein
VEGGGLCLGAWEGLAVVVVVSDVVVRWGMFFISL